MEHCDEGYGNRHRLHSADNMANKKFSYDNDDQVDSGLGSLGYVSGDLDSCFDSSSSRQFIEVIQEEDVQKNIEQATTEVRPACGVDNIVHSLDRLRIASKQSSDPTRCDSGLQASIDATELHSNAVDIRNVNEHYVSPPFSPGQIMEIYCGDEDGDNHLHLSIIHGLPEVAMQVIGLAPSADWLSQANNMLQTPLHLAVITRQVAVVRRLLCAGAAIDTLDLAGNTPLHNACRLGFEDVVRTLLTPVKYEETYQNRFEAPHQRIPQDLELKNYEGLTCLHLAAVGGHTSVMRLLLCNGANINAAEGKNGRTVLHMSADWGHIEMLRYLLTRPDTNIDARTYSGLTPILLAFGRNRMDAMTELYTKGASCETLSLSEESEGDVSEDEMMEEIYTSTASGRAVHQVSVEQAFQPTNR